MKLTETIIWILAIPIFLYLYYMLWWLMINSFKEIKRTNKEADIEIDIKKNVEAIDNYFKKMYGKRNNYLKENGRK